MKKNDEQWHERMYRLFGDENIGFERSTRILTFQVTEACSLACTYCYETHKEFSHKMPFEVAKTVIDQLLTDDPRIANYYPSKNMPGIVLDFIGGEPLLEIDLIDQIVDYFRITAARLHHPWASHYTITLCSNGLAYFSPKFQEFIAKNIDNLGLNISIDGTKELHDAARLDLNGKGSYDRAFAAVQHWHNHWHGYTPTKMTIAPSNIDYMAKAVIELISGDYDKISFNPVYEEGWTIEHARKYYKYFKEIGDYLLNDNLIDKVDIPPFNPNSGHPLYENQNYCGGGNGSMLSVDWRGDYYPCIRFMESSLNGAQEPYKIGDIYHGIGYTDIEKERIKELSEVNRLTTFPPKCMECPIATGCGLCSGYCYQVNGTIKSKTTYICDLMKARSLALAYFWNSYYRQNGRSDRYKIDCPKDWALEIIDEDEWNMLKALELPQS